MKDWRNLKVGDKATWTTKEFDGKAKATGTITEVSEDHAILTAEGMNLWIDDDTAEDFKRA